MPIAGIGLSTISGRVVLTGWKDGGRGSHILLRAPLACLTLSYCAMSKWQKGTAEWVDTDDPLTTIYPLFFRGTLTKHSRGLCGSGKWDRTFRVWRPRSLCSKAMSLPGSARLHRRGLPGARPTAQPRCHFCDRRRLSLSAVLFALCLRWKGAYLLCFLSSNRSRFFAIIIFPRSLPIISRTSWRRYQKTATRLMDANSGFEPATFDDEVFKFDRQPINRGPWLVRL